MRILQFLLSRNRNSRTVYKILINGVKFLRKWLSTSITRIYNGKCQFDVWHNATFNLIYLYKKSHYLHIDVREYKPINLTISSFFTDQISICNQVT